MAFLRSPAELAHLVYYYLLIIYQFCGMNPKYTSTVINWVILCRLFDLQKLKRLNVGNILAFLNFDRLAFSCDLKVWAENKHLENWAALITLVDLHCIPYIHGSILIFLSYLILSELSDLIQSSQIFSNNLMGKNYMPIFVLMFL